MKVLNIAEKPSAAQEISSLLAKGKANKRSGISKFNPVWDFKYDIFGTSCDFTFTSVTGHLMTTDVVEPYTGWHSCSPIELFHVPVHKFVPEANSNLLKSLQSETRSADALILWLDCDKEGENIAFEVLETCKKVKKGLKIYRARFSSIISAEINKAMKNLVTPNELDSIAVDTRIEIDLRLGAAFTRFQTMYLNSRFQISAMSNTIDGDSGNNTTSKSTTGERTILSYGPCQFPTLGFIVDRYLRIINFRPEDFWKISVVHDKIMKEPGGQEKEFKVEFDWKRKRLFEYQSCFALYEKCLDDPEAIVVEVTSKDSRYRPLPLTTIELQKLAAKKLKMSSIQIMNIAEELYNEGLISYPRTETDSFQDGTEFQTLIETQYQSTQWGKYAEDLLKGGKFLSPKSGKNNDNSHPPIHPVKFAGNLPNGPKKNLYEMITRRFLACCSRESVYSNSSVTIDIAGEFFSETGTTLKELGYLEVYPYDKRTDKLIPPYEKGERFLPRSIDIVSGSTQAPSFMSEVELLTAMDNNKIGTDATMAQHIQKIQERKYVEKIGNKFHPTNLGIALIAGYDSMGFEFSKPSLRAMIESDVNLISLGKRTKQQVLKDTIEKYKELFIRANQQTQCFDLAFNQFYQSKVTSEIKGFSKCGKCQKKSMSLISIPSDDGSPQSSLKCNDCLDTFRLPKKGSFKENSYDCKICGYQALIVIGENSSYSICPKCRNSPPSFFKEKSPFHCFQCSKDDCPLAGKKDKNPKPTNYSSFQNNNNNNNAVNRNKNQSW